jgi:hypothetical protein
LSPLKGNSSNPRPLSEWLRQPRLGMGWRRGAAFWSGFDLRVAL